MTKTEILNALVAEIKKNTKCILATEFHKKKKPANYNYMGV